MIKSDNATLTIKAPFDWSMAILIAGSIAYAGVVAGVLAMYPNLLN